MAEKYVALSGVKRKIDYVLSVYSNGLVSSNVSEALKRVPVEDVVPVVHAKWIICSDGYYPYCSNCKREPQGREMTKFCPNCGAKMDDDENR